MTEIPKAQSNEFFDSLRKHTSTATPSKWNVLIYGRLNTGKTTFLTTFPRPVVIASFEPNGASSIRDIIGESNGQVMVVNKTEQDNAQQPVAYTNLLSLISALTAGGANAPIHKIGTFCIDGFTLLSESILSAVCVEKSHEVPSQPDYFLQLQRVKQLVKQCLAMPCNFAMTCHESIHSDPNLGIFQRTIEASPSIKTYLPGIFDEVYYMTVTKDGRKIITQSNGEVMCRSRLGANKKLALVEEPNFMKLLEKAGTPQQHKEVV